MDARGHALWTVAPSCPHPPPPPRSEGLRRRPGTTQPWGRAVVVLSRAATMSSTVHSPYYLYQLHILFPSRRNNRAPPERTDIGEVQIRARCARRDARHGKPCRRWPWRLVARAPGPLVAVRGEHPARDGNGPRLDDPGDRRGDRDRRRQLCHSGAALDRHRAPARARCGDLGRRGGSHHHLRRPVDLQVADLSGRGVPLRSARPASR